MSTLPSDEKCIRQCIHGKSPHERCVPCEKEAEKGNGTGFVARSSNERNILDLAKNLQDELHVYCKGAAGSGDNFYARTFANLADRADELVKLLESAPETRASPFDRAAILADPRERRISMSFETQEQYEAALVFLDMADTALKANPPPPTPWPGANPNKSAPDRCPAREMTGDRCIEHEGHNSPHRFA